MTLPLPTFVKFHKQYPFTRRRHSDGSSRKAKLTATKFTLECSYIHFMIAPAFPIASVEPSHLPFKAGEAYSVRFSTRVWYSDTISMTWAHSGPCRFRPGKDGKGCPELGAETIDTAQQSPKRRPRICLSFEPPQTAGESRRKAEFVSDSTSRCIGLSYLIRV